MKPIILNSEGQPIVLNEQEQRVAAHNEKICNSLGFDIDITTLTTIVKKVSEQKFFEIPPADFLPVRVGEGAWSSVLLTYRSFNMADDFETGIVNSANNNGRLAQADSGVDSVSVDVINWGKTIGWNLIELNQAAKAGNWDIVTSKERSRKKNWDLGIQKIAFLGVENNSAVNGLYTQTGVTANTTRITKAISTMTPAELKAFLAGVVDDYRTNCNRTAWPTHFILPESDYLGLASQASADFPIKTTLELIIEALRSLTRNPNFQVLPCAYGDALYSTLSVQRYVMLNYEEESVRMDIPVDYTNTLANSIDNFSFQNVGYGQFTGVQTYRPLEMLYFEYTPS
jgi:hypothetical protein